MRAQFLSWCYRQKRKQMIRKAKVQAKRNAQMFDLETVIEAGEKALKYWRSSPINSFLFKFDTPTNKAVKLYDLTFPTPITFAAFQGDLNQLTLWMDMGIGGGSFKTVVYTQNTGNKRPRIAQVMVKGIPHLINAMGLPGRGVKGFLNVIGSSPLWTYKRPLGISIGGQTPEEYWNIFLEIEEVLSKKYASNRYYYELNVSCPNTEKGKDFLSNPKQLEKLLTMMRYKTDRVIGVKLSPDQSNESLVSFALITKQISKTFLVLGNTQFKTCEQVGLPNAAISIGGGGLSGPALFKRTEEMMDIIAPLGIPFIATGGISTVEQVKTCLNKGAVAVGMATALVLDPYVIPKINQQL